MSLLKPIDMTGKPSLRDAIKSLMAGKVGEIALTETVNVKIKRESGNVSLIITEGGAEVVLKGLPDPDILKAVCYENHAIVSLRLTDVRVNY